MWTVINKASTQRPDSVSKYRDFKPYLREEAEMKCVYCATSEGYLGGSDSYHVEHFRPKSLAQFESLLKEYSNLFYTCAICNRFKSNDWPSDPNDLTIACYIDPNLHNYNEFFTINDDFSISGTNVASRYMVERVNLNRTQLINVRREVTFRSKFPKVYNTFNKLLIELTTKSHPDGKELLIEALELIEVLMGKWNAEKRASQYEPAEIKR